MGTAPSVNFLDLKCHLQLAGQKTLTSLKPTNKSKNREIKNGKTLMRVFFLIAQLVVQKLFLGAHFKIPFCWLSSLDVSIRTLLSFPFFTGFSGFIIWRHIHQTKIKVFFLHFSWQNSIILRCTLQKNVLPCQLCSPTRISLESFS